MTALREHAQSRFIFQRRAFVTTAITTMQVKTIDVSEKYFGVAAAEPLRIGQSCSIALNSVVGDRIIQQTFDCETIYCVLAGFDHFRIGLQMQNLSPDAKNQLSIIIANCVPSLM